jgi:hypothetical protein
MGREVKRVPLDFDWPLKTVWKGYGNYPEKDVHPPTGPGWQMWENTSEGSPISPVFKTPEKLATGLSKSKASAMGGQTATRAEWLNMIHEGSALTGVMNTKTGVVRSGISMHDKPTLRTRVQKIADAFKARQQQQQHLPGKDIDRER